MTVKIRLPWPEQELNPNWRGHWAQRYKAKKRAKEYAYYTVKALGYNCIPMGDGELRLKMTFYPPDDYRTRDQDNFVASQKSAIDGMAAALGIDDSRFKLDRPEWGNVVDGGEVILELEEL